MTEHDHRQNLKWSTQLSILPQDATPSTLKGDRIILPPSALEQLLSAATSIVSTEVQPQTTSFDPYNPYSFAAERQARENLVERQQHLPHPLTFRLVNPANGRILYAGIREFSAAENTVGLSSFVRTALGIDDPTKGDNGTREDSSHSVELDSTSIEALPRLTVHVQELPKGTFVKLRPLEAGYDADDWKALLEQHLHDTFTTLTNGEEVTIPAGKEKFRFLVHGLKPNEEAVSLVDTDLEVDIEPLSEEQARETLHILAKKSTRPPGTKDGSSAGGRLIVDNNETGQVRSSEYVDYELQAWDASQDLDIELTTINEDRDLDLFVTPFGSKHRVSPRDDDYVFGDTSSRATKRVKVSHTNVEMDGAEALRISVRGWPEGEATKDEQSVPAHYNLKVSYEDSESDKSPNVTLSESDPVGTDEERCSNCHQAVPKRTVFLHQNFCLRNNVVCPQCRNVFQKTSEAWSNHWHCPHDDAFGNTSASKAKHDQLMHTARHCSFCDYEAFNSPDLAHHRTTLCPGKLILCQFCHLQVPQKGEDDPEFDSAELLLSGLTPHEISDGARTTECHLCSKIVRLRDMSTHLKHHDLQRLSRPKLRICRNANCGRTIDGVSRTGEVRASAPRNELGLCDTCFGPLYVSQYDPDGKALRRRVERKYLTQLLTGCNQPWCRNEICKSGRKQGGVDTESNLGSKDAMAIIRPLLDRLRDLQTSIYFCVDEPSQKRRLLATFLSAETFDVTSNTKGKGKAVEGTSAGWDIEWCVAALEAESGDLDKARGWLKGFAPTRAETSR
ncbi:MAG: hypothetical protein OHK93_004232 [Ramalina farinacea]|uniref:Ubiquitin-protein ligase E3A N-terminal zinc-binding domain-containing protein n=1 Tax=Ramalina farinacea TaxID=258253 RepID=A0AA43QGD6_9LECA|nr:hypothetical protein [Ramalina farinacea]